MDKKLIKMRFSNNLDSYNKNAKIQKIMAEKLVTKLQKKSFDSILEIGCGSGFVTDLLHKNIKYQNYTAIDLVEACGKFISSIDSNIQFTPCDIEEFLEENHKRYDLIISNATLQWMDDFIGVINNLQSRLNKDGELAITTFGKENFREIYDVSDVCLKYFSKKELLDKLGQNYIIDEEIRVLIFQNPVEVLKHIQATGVNAVTKKQWTKKDLKIFEECYMNYCSNKPTLTYNPVYINFTKKY